MAVFGGENSESYYDEGVTAAMKGDLARAAECFDKAIRLDNSNAAAYHQLGKTLLRTGQTDRAVELLREVVRKRPKQVPPRLDLGYALLGGGDPAGAREQFDRVVHTDASNARALLGLAQVAFQEGNWMGAVEQAEAAKGISGPSFGILFLLGRAARLAGSAELSAESLDQADKLLEKTVEMNPDKPEGHYLRGEVAFVRDQFSTALEYYRSAEDRCKPDRFYSAFGESFCEVDVLAKEGLCYQRLSKMDRAREMGERILAVDPNHKIAQALYNLE
jgi:tetratricopeptide (TPR) repeat protein